MTQREAFLQEQIEESHSKELQEMTVLTRNAVANAAAAEQKRLMDELEEAKAALQKYKQDHISSEVELEKLRSVQDQKMSEKIKKDEEERQLAEAVAAALTTARVAQLQAEHQAIIDQTKLDAAKEIERLKHEKLVAEKDAAVLLQARLDAEREARRKVEEDTAAAMARLNAERVAEREALEKTEKLRVERLAAEETEKEAQKKAEKLRAERLAADEAARLKDEKEALEKEVQKLRAERLAAEEAARLEAEKDALEKAEKLRLEAENEALEKAEKLRAERVAAEEAARLEAEKEALEKVERARAERLAAEEAARLEAEKEALEKAERGRAERLAAEEAARLEAEKEALEKAEKLRAERLAAEEAARLEAEKEALEKLEKVRAERLAAEEAACLEAEKEALEKAERLRAEVVAVEKEATEKAEKEALETADKVCAAEESARLEAEREALERLEKARGERLAAEEAARREAEFERKRVESKIKSSTRLKAEEDDAANKKDELFLADEVKRLQSELVTACDTLHTVKKKFTDIQNEALTLKDEKRSVIQVYRDEADKKRDLTEILHVLSDNNEEMSRRSSLSSHVQSWTEDDLDFTLSNGFDKTRRSSVKDDCKYVSVDSIKGKLFKKTTSSPRNTIGSPQHVVTGEELKALAEAKRVQVSKMSING
jgi:hypothetical protein